MTESRRARPTSPPLRRSRRTDPRFDGWQHSPRGGATLPFRSNVDQGARARRGSRGSTRGRRPTSKPSGRPVALRRVAPKVIQRQPARDPATREPAIDPIDELLGSTLNERPVSPPTYDRPGSSPTLERPASSPDLARPEDPLDFDRPAPALAYERDSPAFERQPARRPPDEEETAARALPHPPPEAKRFAPEPAKPAPAAPEEAGADSPRDVMPTVISRPRDHDEDDEDDDSDFEPAFDLLGVLSSASLAAKDSLEPMTVEVVQFRDDRVISVRHIAPAESPSGSRGPTSIAGFAALTARSFSTRRSADPSTSVKTDGPWVMPRRVRSQRNRGCVSSPGCRSRSTLGKETRGSSSSWCRALRPVELPKISLEAEHRPPRTDGVVYGLRSRRGLRVHCRCRPRWKEGGCL